MRRILIEAFEVKRLGILAEFLDRERFKHDSAFDDLTDALETVKVMINRATKKVTR